MLGRKQPQSAHAQSAHAQGDDPACCMPVLGVLVVPSLLVISQFTAIAAVALSNVTILASAVANLIFNLPRKSILRPGPLIDWDLVLLFGPPTVMGSIAGSYINMVVPSW